MAEESKSGEVLQKLRAGLLVTPVQARASIIEALMTAKGNTSRAAVLLGISRRSFERLLTEMPELRVEAAKLRRQRRERKPKAREPLMVEVPTVLSRILPSGEGAS